MRSVKSISFLLAVAILAGFPGSGNADEMEPISEDKAKLIFYAPGLEDAVRRFWAYEHIDETYKESGTWQNLYGGLPRGSIFLWEVAFDSFFSEMFSTKDVESFWFEGKELNFEDERQSSNLIGTVQYRVFSPVDTPRAMKCVAFSQAFGIASFVSHEAPVGSKLLVGYYCDTSLSPDKVKAVLANIGVKGDAEPPKP